MTDHGKAAKPSLTEKYLPKDVWRMLSIKTSYGSTIYDCARSALENPDSNVGLYAPGGLIRILFPSHKYSMNLKFNLFCFCLYVTDPECYDTFAEVFHPVIAEYHKVDVKTLKSIHDLGDAANLEDLPENFQNQIVSTRVRVGRTVKGYPMQGKMTREVTLLVFFFVIAVFLTASTLVTHIFSGGFSRKNPVNMRKVHLLPGIVRKIRKKLFSS